MVNLIFIVLTYKKEEFDLFSTAAFFLFLVEMCIYFASDKVQNELIEITNKDLEFIKTCTLQNQKIENVIEFFKDTSEEEVQKYLSYKMGDSKKINQLYLVFFVTIRYNTYIDLEVIKGEFSKFLERL